MFSVNDVRVAVATLKKSKVLGCDRISSKPFLYADDALVYALTDLFDMCIIYSFVPDSFSSCVIVHVLEDKNGDAGKYSNYRPTSLVTILFKLLDLCFADQLACYLQVEELQFVFVPNKGCQKALFTEETAVNYFTCRGSPVFMALLDISKAFDRTNHFALFYKLIDIGISLYTLNVLIN